MGVISKVVVSELVREQRSDDDNLSPRLEDAHLKVRSAARLPLSALLRSAVGLNLSSAVFVDEISQAKTDDEILSPNLRHGRQKKHRKIPV